MDSFKKTYLQYHKSLNQKIFDNDILRSDVRDILLKNAYEWIKFVGIPKSIVKDIILTGGNSQYNYTKYSDIDLHIIYDEKKLGLKGKFLEKYLINAKNIWIIQHNIKIKGYPLEIYAQDTKNKLVAIGIYSILNNCWVKYPTKGNYDFKHDDTLNLKVKFYIDIIENMIKNNSNIEDFKNIKEKLKNMRKNALLNGDEFSFDNLLFKALRNSKILDKMNNYIKKRKDKELSLEGLTYTN